jgi:hypothetical protein
MHQAEDTFLKQHQMHFCQAACTFIIPNIKANLFRICTKSATFKVNLYHLTLTSHFQITITVDLGSVTHLEVGFRLSTDANNITQR